MAKVKVRRTFRRGDTGEVCRIGTVVEVPANMAKRLAAQGYAETVSAEPAKTGATTDEAGDGDPKK